MNEALSYCFLAFFITVGFGFGLSVGIEYAEDQIAKNERECIILPDNRVECWINE